MPVTRDNDNNNNNNTLLSPLWPNNVNKLCTVSKREFSEIILVLENFIFEF
jgi:hypothetical protein